MTRRRRSAIARPRPSAITTSATASQHALHRTATTPARCALRGSPCRFAADTTTAKRPQVPRSGRWIGQEQRRLAGGSAAAPEATAPEGGSAAPGAPAVTGHRSPGRPSPDARCTPRQSVSLRGRYNYREGTPSAAQWQVIGPGQAHPSSPGARARRIRRHPGPGPGASAVSRSPVTRHPSPVSRSPVTRHRSPVTGQAFSDVPADRRSSQASITRLAMPASASLPQARGS